MNTEHTKGTWEAEYCLDQSIIIMANETPIAMLQSEEEEGITDEMVANSKLIASAPELLKALVLCESITDKCNNAMLPQHIQELLKSINETMKQVINKATN